MPFSRVPNILRRWCKGEERDFGGHNITSLCSQFGRVVPFAIGGLARENASMPRAFNSGPTKRRCSPAGADPFTREHSFSMASFRGEEFDKFIYELWHASEFFSCLITNGLNPQELLLPQSHVFLLASCCELLL